MGWTDLSLVVARVGEGGTKGALGAAGVGEEISLGLPGSDWDPPPFPESCIGVKLPGGFL